MSDVEQVAKSVLLKARLQAENLIAGAMEEAEQLKEQAKQEGFQQGVAEGQAAGLQEGLEAGRQEALQQQAGDLQSVVAAITEAVNHFESHRRALEEQATRDVVKLSLAIARRVVKRQVAVDPLVLEANLSEAMRLAVGASDLHIAVHPEDQASLQEALPRLRLQWPDLKHVHLIEDATLSRGGCRLFTGGGSVDADLQSQLDRIADELLPEPEAAAGDDAASDGGGAS